jgi:hypothetical protein
MIALDAKTGDRIQSFGRGGIVDLKQEIDQQIDRWPRSACTQLPSSPRT